MTLVLRPFYLCYKLVHCVMFVDMCISKCQLHEAEWFCSFIYGTLEYGNLLMTKPNTITIDWKCRMNRVIILGSLKEVSRNN